MDTITDVRSIRVIRSYRDEPLDAERIAAIADAGRKAGSSKNTQRWDFVTVLDRDHIAALGQAGYFSKHVPSAGGVIALVVEKPDADHARSVLWDLGRAAQNMMLTAWAMGIGSCPITVHHYEVAAKVLALPGDRQCEYIITFGWPSDPDDLTRPSQAGGRKDAADVIHQEQW